MVIMSLENGQVVSDEDFKPSYSSVDLMTLSPEHKQIADNDLLTGTDETDTTMENIPVLDEMLYNPQSLDYFIRRPKSCYKRCHVDPGKESLYAKFDPLFTKANQETLPENLQIVHSCTYDTGYETASVTISDSETNFSIGNCTELADSIQSLNLRDKPMQVVLPSFNPENVKMSVNSSQSAPTLVRSLSAITSSEVFTDNLISVEDCSINICKNTPSNIRKNQMSKGHHQSLKELIESRDHNMFQVQQENEKLLNISQDMVQRCTGSLESIHAEINKIKEEISTLKKEENDLNEKLKMKTTCNEKMCLVMEEYEKTISSLIAQQQKDRIHYQEVENKIRQERDEVLSHLDSMESSFHDFLLKYEKRKTMIREQEEKENILLKKLTGYEEEIKQFENTYEELKKMTAEKLSKANSDYQNMIKNHNLQLTKLNAMIEKQEVKISSLQESLDRKTKDNEEITRICDQLISKVGP